MARGKGQAREPVGDLGERALGRGNCVQRLGGGNRLGLPESNQETRVDMA